MVKPLFDERELLHKIADGDALAFKQVYLAYNDKIFKFAFRLLGSREPAREVVQETMLRLWQLGYKLKEIDSLEAYLKTIAKRRAIDLLRQQVQAEKAERQLGIAYQDGHRETEENILLRESRRILEEGIQLLPKQQRLVYRLCQQQGLKYEEAAAQLNLSHGTVQTHMKLALKFLREYVLKHSEVAAILVILRLL